MLTGLTLAVMLAGLNAGPTLVTIRVHPTTIDLTHHRDPRSVQVMGIDAEGYTIDLRTEAKYTVADPKIATIGTDGWVKPVTSGKTELTVAVAGQTIKIPVTVTLPTTEPPMSFLREVMPVLTQTGCNSGACHGYSLGKNGFKLSLRGEAPSEDYLAICRDLMGRRLTRIAPDRSLLVQKGRGDVPHEGGTRFSRSSLANEILVRWIADGAPADVKEPSKVVSVQLVPNVLTLAPGQKHRLQVIARHEDGTTRDVTRLAVFAANNDRFAFVDGEGLVTAGDAGETAIVGRFERTFTATNVTVLPPNPGFKPTPVPQGNLIDRHIVEKLNRLKIKPTGLADDETFLRRVHLDLIGVQPTPDEVRAFLKDKSADRRDKVIDALFERPEFVDHWSLKWGDLLQNSRNVVSSPSVYLFREFIRDVVASNMPMDRFAKRLLTARGGAVDDPASVYYAISKDTNDTVERVTQVFCGVRMLCARCHSHPMENWSQAEYFGVASFFTQVNVRTDARFRSVPNSRLVALNLNAGLAIHPRTGLPQAAKFLGGEEPKLSEGADRRTAYAEWLTSSKNPFFARGLVNRVWSYFFHRGIIDPVDDVRSTNPPINPGLLDALTRDFIDHRFDIRHLMRRIVTSETYQRGSEPTPSNRHDELNFSRAVPRRIPAEALLDSLVQATAVPEAFGGAPAGFRAAQLPDGTVENAFLRLFGKPQRMDACECERDNTSNLLQALHFINGRSILSRVQNSAGRPALLMRGKLTDEQMVTEAYLWSLSRNPRPAELKVSLEFIRSYGDKRAEALQDMMWALLNSKDFLLVH